MSVRMTNEPRNFFSGAIRSLPTPRSRHCCCTRSRRTRLTTRAIGVSKDNWTAQISGSNLSNAYGPTNVSSGQFIKSEIPLRPRVVMFLIGYKF